MFRFPYFGFPYYYPTYQYYPKHIIKEPIEHNTKKNDSITNNSISNTIAESKTENEQAIFEILGIKLYLDDLVILCVLFSLYQEEVKDEMLYIILILLLLS